MFLVFSEPIMMTLKEKQDGSSQTQTLDRALNKVDSGPESVRLGRVALILLILATILWSAALDFLPPMEKDSLIHHLAIPKLWLQASGLADTPWAHFSYYPMNLELLYLIPLSLHADWGAKLIHHAFGILTAALIFFYTRRRLGANWGLLAALLLLSTPIIMRLAASAYVDLGLAFFLTASLLALVRWSETKALRYFVLSATALGLALGTKYNALIALPLLGLGAAGIMSRQGHGTGRSILWAGGYLILALLVFSPWAVKNLIMTGNPIYPLYNQLWGLAGVTPAGQDFDIFTIRRFLFGESSLQTILIPLRAFFQGRDFSPQFFDGVLSPILIILPPLALVRPAAPELRPLAAFAALWVVLVFLSSSFLIRYIVPILPILAILTVFGLKIFWSMLVKYVPRRPALALFTLTIALSLYPNAAWAYGFWTRLDPVPFLSGQETRSAYLARRLDHYPAMEFINRRVGPQARILFLFAGGRGYYCERDYFYRAYYSGEILRPVLDRAASWTGISQGLRKMGATHILTREALLDEYLKVGLSPDKLGLWQDFKKNGLKKLFQAKGYTLYGLK